MLDQPKVAPPVSVFPRTGFVPVQHGMWQKPVPAGPRLQWKDATGFEWNEYLLAIPQLPAELEGFRVVQLADLHCRGNWQRAYDELIARLTEDEPDLLLFTGDLVEDPGFPHSALPTAIRLVSQLRGRLGFFGLLGNHDRELERTVLAGTTLRWIDGQQVLVNGETPVEIIAIPGPQRKDLPAGFTAAVPAKTPGVPRLVMSHYPDHIRPTADLHADIFFAGHTHGGQICLPGRWPILRHDSLPRRLTRQVHRVRTSWLVVNRGLGFSSSFQCRAFCPAEVVDVRLTRE